MTKRKAEVLTGYEVRPIPNEKSGFRFGAFSGDDLIVEAEHRSERVALVWLVNAVYQLHSHRVLERHGWRCVHCGGGYRLQIHHRKFRSHGGTHRPENLEPVCGDCHRRRRCKIHATAL